MSTTEKKAIAPKKGTVNTEAIIGSATNNLKKVVEEISKATSTIEQLVETSETLSAQIADKEIRIDELGVTYSEKKRQADVSFKLDVEADKEKVVLEILSNTGRIAIKQAEYTELVTKLNSAEATLKSEVAKAEAIVASRLKREYDVEKQLAESKHVAATAEMQAELKQKNAEIVNLTTSVAAWQKALDSERQAGIERAKAGAVGTINVSGAGK